MLLVSNSVCLSPTAAAAAAAARKNSPPSQTGRPRCRPPVRPTRTLQRGPHAVHGTSKTTPNSAAPMVVVKLGATADPPTDVPLRHQRVPPTPLVGLGACRGEGGGLRMVPR